MSNSRKLNKALQTTIFPQLKIYGFNCSGESCIRKQESVVHIVNFQCGRKDDGGIEKLTGMNLAGKFTVNIGVFYSYIPAVINFYAA